MTVTSKFFVHALPSENVQKNHLVGIDLLRFFAAFSVMAFHMAFWSWAPNISTPRSISGGVFRYPEVSALSASGWVGVEIFFVISGGLSPNVPPPMSRVFGYFDARDWA